MPRVDLQIPSLTGGISQQPSVQRNADQLDACTNAILPVTVGLTMRAGTNFIEGAGAGGKLEVNSDTSNEFQPRWIERSATERFIALVNPTLTSGVDCVQIFDFDGTKISVVLPTDAGDDPKDYITAGTSPVKEDIHLINFLDTVIITNRNVNTAANTGDGQTYTHNGENVRDRIIGGTDNHHRINALGTDASATNNYDEGFLFPPTAADEYWYAEEDSLGYPAGFYETQNTAGPQPWYVRIQTEEEGSTLDRTTLPIKLVYDPAGDGGDGEFTGSFNTWVDRLSGDSITNPGPSFLGKPIQATIFFSNRLWFAADELLVGSRIGDYYNLWLNNINVAADDDKIEHAVFDAQTNLITMFQSFTRALVLFTDSGRQYELRADGILSPSNYEVIPTTAYRTATIDPVVMGNQLYFFGNRGEYATVYEYLYQFDAANNVAPEMTLHVKELIPAPIRARAFSPINDMLFLVPENETNAVYVYHGQFIGDQKVQSAWSKFLFDELYDIHSLFVSDNELFLLMRIDKTFFLEKMDLIPEDDTDADGTMPFNVRLDRKVTVTGTYDSASDSTFFDLPYLDSTCNTVVLGSGWDERTGESFTGTVSTVSELTRVTVNGDLSDHEAWVGRPFTMTATLSEQFVRDENGRAVSGTLQLMGASIYHKNSSVYQLDITSKGRSTETELFTPLRLGDINNQLGNYLIEEEGVFNTKVFASAEETTLSIVANGPGPVTITKITFTGHFVPFPNPAA